MCIKRLVLPDGSAADGEVMRFTIAFCAPVDRSSGFSFMFLAYPFSFPGVHEVILILLYVMSLLVLFDVVRHFVDDAH